MARQKVVAPATPQRFAQCRSLGHEWKYKGKVGHNDPTSVLWGSIGLQSQCSVCTTWRTKWITRSGEVATRYEHPDGYSQTGEDRLSLQEWRSTFVTSLWDDDLVGVA